MIQFIRTAKKFSELLLRMSSPVCFIFFSMWFEFSRTLLRRVAFTTMTSVWPNRCKAQKWLNHFVIWTFLYNYNWSHKVFAMMCVIDSHVYISICCQAVAIYWYINSFAVTLWAIPRIYSVHEFEWQRYGRLTMYNIHESSSHENEK